MKCIYNKTCILFKCKNKCCKSNKTAKNYYGLNRPCGCYRNMKDISNEDKT